MAYSGLGAGTQADPYQITTVSQFKEMGDSVYSGAFFLQMNDIDFTEEPGFSFTYFSCKYDGGGYRAYNLQLYTGGQFVLRDQASISNAKLEFSRFYAENLPVFVPRYRATVSMQNIEVKCYNRDGVAVVLFGSNINDTHAISGIKAEGKFSMVFGSLYTGISDIYVYNSISSHVPLIENVSEAITLNSLFYCKPYTYTNAVDTKGVLINTTQSYAITLNNSAVIVSSFIDEATSSYPIGGLLGSGIVNANNCYVFGYFRSTKSRAMHAMYGSYQSTSCTFANCYFYGDLVSGAKSDTSVLSALPSTGCYYCKELLTNQTYGDAYATNLTVTQFKEASNFTGWDFTAIWEQGTDRPLLKTPNEASIIFDNQSTYDTGDIQIGDVLKVSATEYTVELITTNTRNYGVDVVEFGVVVDSKVNQKGVVTFEATGDIEAVINAYALVDDIKFLKSTKSYYHVFREQIAVTDIIVDKYVSLLAKGAKRGSYVHGTIVVGEYLYGTSRGVGTSPSPLNSLVKAKVSDVSQFTLFNTDVRSGVGSRNMDSICCIGSKLYSVAMDESSKAYMIVWDIIAETYQSYYIADGDTEGAPSCSDGQHIYVYLRNKAVKISPSVFNSIEQFNTGTVWPINATEIAIEPTQYVHTMVVDGDNLYLGTRPVSEGYNNGFGKVLKVDKSTMTLTGAANVPPMTDDMCQTDTHLFIGVEQYPATSVGYNVGCCAIRKSDLNVTQLRKLHETDTMTSTGSYASLIFGNYLIDIKTNSHIYALDITDPDSWDNDDMGAHTLKVYKMLQPDGETLTDPINEVYLTEAGKFIGFAWNATSHITAFELTGLNYFAEPTVITDDATIVDDNDVSLSGYITSTGGKTVTAVGIILGQSSDLSDGVDYPVTPVTTAFEKALADLAYGRYYFRSYATNAEGTGYGEIKFFTLEVPYTEPGQPTDLYKAIQVEITVSWTAPADDGGTPITGYKIERKASDGDWAVAVADTESTATTYTETLPQGAYQYRVSAITAYATSAPSVTLDVNAVVGGAGKYRIFLGSTEITTVE